MAAASFLLDSHLQAAVGALSSLGALAHHAGLGDLVLGGDDAGPLLGRLVLDFSPRVELLALLVAGMAGVAGGTTRYLAEQPLVYLIEMLLLSQMRVVRGLNLIFNRGSQGSVRSSLVEPAAASRWVLLLAELRATSLQDVRLIVAHRSLRVHLGVRRQVGRPSRVRPTRVAGVDASLLVLNQEALRHLGVALPQVFVPHRVPVVTRACRGLVRGGLFGLRLPGIGAARAVDQGWICGCLAPRAEVLVVLGELRPHLLRKVDWPGGVIVVVRPTAARIAALVHQADSAVLAVVAFLALLTHPAGVAHVAGSTDRSLLLLDSLVLLIENDVLVVLKEVGVGDVFEVEPLDIFDQAVH